MSENAINAALRSLGIESERMCGHGFRAMARTVLEEHLKFPAHLIEAQLAHAVRDANGRAYNRTTHLEERRIMMQRWADYIDESRAQRQGASNEEELSDTGR
jgi:integrase